MVITHKSIAHPHNLPEDSHKIMKAAKTLIISSLVALATMNVACDSSSEIGNSLVGDEIEIVIDSTFTMTGKSVDNDFVLSRTITQLIGRINAPGYGTLSSDIVTQFMPALSLDTEDVQVEYIDSLKLIFQMNLGAYTGDSVAPLGLEVYRLKKQLPSPIYSNFDPEGYYDKNDLLGSTIYNTTAIGQSDSIQELSYRTIYVTLPRSLGQELFTQYKNNPAAFSDPEAFANIFPGLYIKNSYGSGRVTRIDQTTMRLYYHRTYYDEDEQKDSPVYKIGNYFAVTPEIVTNNNIKLNIEKSIRDRVNKGENIIIAPAGLDVEIKFPAREIINSYRANTAKLAVVNSLSFDIPAEEIENKYNIAPPTNLLMVLSSKKDKFFADNSLTDSKTSFYATYDEDNQVYSFTGLRDYILDLLDKSEITDDDITFTLTPVEVTTETVSSYYSTSTYVTQITPYVAQPVMVKLLPENAKIKFVYSKQTIKN
jgi:hypothetical protein